jgi:signal transduction histidine kinase
LQRLGLTRLQRARDELAGLEQDMGYAQEQARNATSAQDNAQGMSSLKEILMSKMQLHLITSRLLAAQVYGWYGRSVVSGLSAGPRLTKVRSNDQHDGLASLQSSSSVSTDARVSIINDRCDVRQLAQDTAEDCRAFCVEKNGEAPEVRVHCATSAHALVVDGHVHFILMELLKNAMKAMMDEYPGASLLDAPPIHVTVSAQGGELGVRISDTGGGIPPQHRQHCMRFFYTSHVEGEANYTYSKNFGARFTGYGVGLPMARIYARIAGGDVGLSVLPGHGTDATLLINKYGAAAIPLE